MPSRTCSLDGCERREKSHGYCSLHLKGWERHGDPTASGAYPTPREWVSIRHAAVILVVRRSLVDQAVADGQLPTRRAVIQGNPCWAVHVDDVILWGDEHGYGALAFDGEWVSQDGIMRPRPRQERA